MKNVKWYVLEKWNNLFSFRTRKWIQKIIYTVGADFVRKASPDIIGKKIKNISLSVLRQTIGRWMNYLYNKCLLILFVDLLLSSWAFNLLLREATLFKRPLKFG